MQAREPSAMLHVRPQGACATSTMAAVRTQHPVQVVGPTATDGRVDIVGVGAPDVLLDISTLGLSE